jgi:quercetin dioxygenase-like cupin family protein
MIVASYGSIVPLTPAFANQAGTIQNLVERECGGVARIRSVAGSKRSSHWHKTDWHYLYIESGEMQYRERPVGVETVTEFIVRAGQMVYTPPRVEHWTFFPVDTVMISISRLSREHEQHEADLVRVDWLE